MSTPPLLFSLLLAATSAYGLGLSLVLGRMWWARGVVAAGLVLHTAWLVWRGVLLGYLPMTNKTESFAAAGFTFALVLVLTWRARRSYVVPLLSLALAASLTAASFPQALNPPGPLLRTVWYLLHVPLSFVGLSVWMASAAAALCFARGGDRAWLQKSEHLALQGLGLWSAAMIFGGVWGVVAWGAAFLWDPKMMWSVLLWFHYSAFIHVRLTPSLQQRLWVRPALAWLGVVWMFVAYVGTSFFFGKSAHAF